MNTLDEIEALDRLADDLEFPFSQTRHATHSGKRHATFGSSRPRWLRELHAYEAKQERQKTMDKEKAARALADQQHLNKRTVHAA